MYTRATSKLHLTNTVIEEGRFSLLDQAQAAAAGLQVGELQPVAQSRPETPCDGLASPPAERDPEVRRGQAAVVGRELGAGGGAGQDPRRVAGRPVGGGRTVQLGHGGVGGRRRPLRCRRTEWVPNLSHILTLLARTGRYDQKKKKTLYNLH